MTKVKPAVPQARHIPQRTCVACRHTGPKREMVRLVHAAGSGIEIDLTGKKSGRGAYICRTAVCWEKALANGRLEYALRTSLKPEDREKLVKFVRGIDNTVAKVKSPPFKGGEGI